MVGNALGHVYIFRVGVESRSLYWVHHSRTSCLKLYENNDYESDPSAIVISTSFGGRGSPGKLMLGFLHSTRAHEIFGGNATVFTGAASKVSKKVSIGGEGKSTVFSILGNNAHATYHIPDQSDVFAQEFASNGNILYNGCRNGRIYLFDIREPANRQNLNSTRQEQPTQYANSNKRQKKDNLRNDKLTWNSNFQHKSSVCWLKILDQSGRHGGCGSHLLSSSLAGEIYMWDTRNSKKPVEEYLGHVNSLSKNNIDMDENENFISAIGEDNILRSWGIATSQLISCIPIENAYGGGKNITASMAESAVFRVTGMSNSRNTGLSLVDDMSFWIAWNETFGIDVLY
ncbi:DDB1 and CUL4 associated factor 4-like 2 [Nowakowskiella sp. JEL0407]|nr:DDB1 and CUL4 associated factor 4-like 2 [Nowakowskiella sp. JEL0407]